MAVNINISIPSGLITAAKYYAGIGSLFAGTVIVDEIYSSLCSTLYANRLIDSHPVDRGYKPAGPGKMIIITGNVLNVLPTAMICAFGWPLIVIDGGLFIAVDGLFNSLFHQSVPGALNE